MTDTEMEEIYQVAITVSEIGDYVRSRNRLFSHHTFLLPFKWKKEDGSPYDIAAFKQLSNEHLSKDKAPEWERKVFSIDRIVDYNEFHYFYDYVSEVLYETSPPPGQAQADIDEDLFIAHYQYRLKPGAGRYLITTRNPKGGSELKEYELEIDSILLHLYYTGVGVISFHLNNRRVDQASPEDILYINQYGRRVYPAFYFIPPYQVGSQQQFDERSFANNVPTGSEIACEITIQLPGKAPFSENWAGHPAERLKEGKKFRFELPGFLKPFLKQIEDGYDITPILDDRMFVLSWYGNSELVNRLCTVSGGANPTWKKDSWWYRYAYVDGPLRTVQDELMLKELLNEATYTRWQDFKTLYAITQYSLVLLTDDLPQLRDNGAAFLVTHLQTIYYRLAELVLVQRASIQRFSDDITDIRKLDGSDDEQTSLANLLNLRYIRFINRIYFREVTAQVQGIEIYDRLQAQARVGQQVDALKNEVTELHSYLAQQSEGRRNERLNSLNILISVLAPPGLLIAYWSIGGMLHCPEGFSAVGVVLQVLALLASSLVSLLAYRERNTLAYLAATAVLVLLLGLTPWLINSCGCQTDRITSPPVPAGEDVPTVPASERETTPELDTIGLTD